jgi:iron complex outermembrane recepter protein
MKARFRVGLEFTASLLLGAAVSTPSWAQIAVGGASSAPSSDSLAEIQVTAQRRSESVMDVPLSITAVTGDQLTKAGITDITDLELTTPGFNVSDSSGYTQVYIRGIGNSIFVGADPSVATFIDDVPRIYGSMVNNFIDVDRVEVLKGAQGGLYGRNATGGVINIVTRQPDTSEFKAEGKFDYGSYETFNESGYINLPFSDVMAMSIAGERIKHDPYIKNVAPANPYSAANFPGGSFIGDAATTAAFFNSGVAPTGTDDADFYGADAKLLFKPTENFKVTVAGDFSNKNDSAGQALMQISPGFVQAGTLNAFLSADAGATPNLPPGFLIGNLPKFQTAQAQAGFVDLKDFGGSVTAVYSAPGVDLSSISAYRGQHTFFGTDLAAGSVPIFGVIVDNRKHYFYEELRAVSTFDGPFHVIGGASWLTSHYKGNTDLNILNPLVPDVPTANALDFVKNYSVYVQPSYDITSDLTITASGRYVKEINTAVFPNTPPPSTEVLAQDKFLPSATLSYKLPGGGTTYARYAEGFKAGGVNPVAPADAFTNPATQGGTFKGEQVKTYEVGVRSPFLENKLQTTFAVFYNDYKNLQTAAHANAAHAAIIEAIINAGSARTYGVEGSVNWRVIQPVTVGLTAGYLNARYKNFENTDPTVLEPFNLSGTRLSNAPEVQAAFTAGYDQPIAPQIRLVANLVVSYTSGILWANSGLPGILPDATQSAYTITNVRIGFRSTNDKYGVEFYANNLFNTGYTTYGSSAAATGTLVTIGNPKILGVELSGKF